MKTRKKLSANASLEPQAAPHSSLTETITRFWVTLFIIGAILYVAALMISRTDGFRSVVRQRLEAFTGLSLQIDRVYAKPGLDLVMEGMRESVTNQTAIPNFEIKQLELSWRTLPLVRGKGWPFHRLHMADGRVQFTQKKDGGWHPFPPFHAMIAPWLEIPSIPADKLTAGAITEWMRQEKMNLSLQNISLVWHSSVADEPPVILIEGLHLKTMPVRPFDQPVMWFDMQIARAANHGVVWARGLHMEWIRLADQDVVLRYQQQSEP